MWIPVTTAQTLTDRGDHIDLILARPPDRRFNDELKREVRTVLARRLHVSPADEEAVFIISLIDMLSGFDSVFAFLNVFLIVLAITTLFIGGIGVMNMMLVSVNERRREIGLRLAVGARRRDVVGQFLAETLVITLVGGFAGLTHRPARLRRAGSVAGRPGSGPGDRPPGDRLGARRHGARRCRLRHRSGVACGARRSVGDVAGGVMLRDLLFEALRNTRAHWLRVLLTSSGIVWGIALFVVMIAIGDANQRHYREKMEVIGRKVIWAIPGRVAREGSGERAARDVLLDLKDPPRLPDRR